jgi:hypothetical protein
MPEEMWQAIRHDKDACTQAFRIVVRQTKAEVLALLKESK